MINYLCTFISVSKGIRVESRKLLVAQSDESAWEIADSRVSSGVRVQSIRPLSPQEYTAISAYYGTLA
jgi:hypothetical protein